MNKLIIFIFCLSIQNTQAQSWRQYYDSTELYWGSDWKKCIKLLENALPIVENISGKNDPNYVVILNDLGLCYNHIGEFQKAEETYKETLLIKKALLGENDLDYAATLLNLAFIYQEQNKYKEAENVYESILQNYQINYGNKHPEYAGILNYFGLLYKASGDYEKAVSSFKSALQIYVFSYGKENIFYATVLKNIGSIYRSKGDLIKSKELISEAVDLSIKILGNEHPDIGHFLMDKASLLEQMAEYGEAERIYITAIEIQKRNFEEEKLNLASSYNSLAGLYIKIGNLEKAKSNFELSLPLYKALLGNNQLDYATALNNYANYFIATNELEQAVIFYNEASEIYKNNVSELHPLYANNIVNLASLYRKLGNYKKSEQYYEKSLEIERKIQGEKLPSYAVSLNNLALLYMAMGKSEKALDLYAKALILKKETYGEKHPTYATSLNNLAVLHLFNEDFNKAIPLFTAAIQHQLNQVKTFFPYMSEPEKDAFYNTIKEDVERYNSIALKKHNEYPNLIGEMYNHQLATKALLFHSSEKVRKNILSSSDKKIISTYNLWQKEKEYLGSLYLLSEEDLKKLNIDLRQQEEKVNFLEKDLSLKSTLFSKENDRKVFNWKDIQKALKPGEAAIEIIRFRNFNVSADNSPEEYKPISYGFTQQVFYAALIISNNTKDAPEIVFLENGEDLENKYFKYYDNAIKYKVVDEISFSMFWEEIHAKLHGITKVYVSPDGVYNKININMLKIPKVQKYVIDEIYIYQLTSTKDLLLEKQPENQDNKIVMIGDPSYLIKHEGNDYYTSKTVNEEINNIQSNSKNIISSLPGTRKEVELIKNFMVSNGYTCEANFGNDAREAILKKIKSPKILHIATHGFFANDKFVRKQEALSLNPLFSSGLLFAGAENSLSSEFKSSVFGDQEDGILTAYEAMNLSLDNTDLVVLSACETGLGEIKNGEGVYGLQRAFQNAGAKAVIISLWKVDDIASVELMENFYKEWFKTKDKRKALMNAQIQMRQKYPHPYYWGGFVMIGK
ncbi:MAG: CHAT domain-containing protein [Bacteroidota bacterium]|nr:CHAT domain-containing protein [Bacteroidota bacterium]